MAAMQALGPEMKKLQQKYKGAENRAQMNEEMMKLYKEHNVNPASGCLPMLLQMPAFFILYSVIRGITNTVTIPRTPSPWTAFKKSSPARSAPSPATSPIPARCTQTSWLLTASSSRSGWTSRRSSSPTTARWFVAIPYLLLVVGAGRTAVPADVPTQCPEPASSTGKSASGHAAEIHAAYIRVYLSKCGGNSECLFHRFERNPHPDAGDPVPKRHRGRSPGHAARRIGSAKQARWSTEPNGRCPSRRRPERRRPAPRTTGGAKPGTSANGKGRRRRGQRHQRRSRGRRRRRPAPEPPVEVDRLTTNGANGKKSTEPANGQPARDRATPGARATGATDRDGADADERSRRPTQGASALEGQA